MFIGLTLVVVALLVAAAFICAPAVTEQEVWAILEGPEWKTAKQVTAAIRSGKKMWAFSLVWLIFASRIRLRIGSLVAQGRLSVEFLSLPVWSAQKYRNTFWNRAEGVVQSRGEFVSEFGVRYAVWVLSQEFSPELEGFVGLVGETIIIADTVPESDRPFYCLHEVLCRLLWKDRCNGCVSATSEEIRAVRKRGSEFAAGYLPEADWLLRPPHRLPYSQKPRQVILGRAAG